MNISEKFIPLLALLFFCFAVFSGQAVNADTAKAVFGVA
jgi:hypothetical protein